MLSNPLLLLLLLVMGAEAYGVVAASNQCRFRPHFGQLRWR
jgi:hypothetical protein